MPSTANGSPGITRFASVAVAQLALGLAPVLAWAHAAPAAHLHPHGAAHAAAIVTACAVGLALAAAAIYAAGIGVAHLVSRAFPSSAATGDRDRISARRR